MAPTVAGCISEGVPPPKNTDAILRPGVRAAVVGERGVSGVGGAIAVERGVEVEPALRAARAAGRKLLITLPEGVPGMPHA